MEQILKNKALKTFKPDAEEAAKRWECFWNGEMNDRPIMLARLLKTGYQFKPWANYQERVFGDMETTLRNNLHNCAGIQYLGESMPDFWISFGTHEIAAYCGGQIIWPENGMDTNWSEPFIDAWGFRALPGCCRLS